MPATAAIPPFHLAFPVRDLEETRAFYAGLIGCTVGREAPLWIDFDFYGHQISAHVRPEEVGRARTNQVDGDNVPVRHFGAILPWDDWHRLADKLKRRAPTSSSSRMSASRARSASRRRCSSSIPRATPSNSSPSRIRARCSRAERTRRAISRRKARALCYGLPMTNGTSTPASARSCR